MPGTAGCYWPLWYVQWRIYVSVLFFFFSSRRRHTRCLSDWSSDVCSSDLAQAAEAMEADGTGKRVARFALVQLGRGLVPEFRHLQPVQREQCALDAADFARSEERRVGKECRSRWSAGHSKKKREKTHEKQM